MQRGMLGLAAAIALAIAAVCALAWHARRPLAFNAQGRHFDAASGIVVHQQSAEITALIAALSGLLGAALLIMALRR